MRILQPRGDPGLRGGGRDDQRLWLGLPVLPEGANVGPQSAQLSRSRPVSRTANKAEAVGWGHLPLIANVAGAEADELADWQHVDFHACRVDPAVTQR